MMGNIFQRWFNREPNTATQNLFNQAFFQMLGGQAAQYDYKASTYLEKGFKINPDVYSIVMQMADKTKAVPYNVKKVKDRSAKSQLNKLDYATKHNLSPQQKLYRTKLEEKAYEDTELPFPLEKPNPLQTWSELFALYKIYLKTTGNAYFYMERPENGAKAGEPRLVYILPSHLMKIILKDGVKILEEDNPISHYMLREGDQYIEFAEENIIHIKYANPFFDMSGGHLYGLSPIVAALRNLESSNAFLDHAVTNGKNGGVFGFITGTENKPLTTDHAKQLKETMIEMDKNPERLSKIAGSSTPIQFTKLSLTTDELKPFEYLKYNQKQLCNIFGWSDSLLNNDEGGKYDKQKEERKRVVMDNIIPDLIMLQEAFNSRFLPKFKAYQGAVIEWDYSELPEMQEDIATMLEWMDKLALTENEKRAAVKYETLDIENMDVPLIANNKVRIDELGLSPAELEKAFRYDD